MSEPVKTTEPTTESTKLAIDVMSILYNRTVVKPVVELTPTDITVIHKMISDNPEMFRKIDAAIIEMIRDGRLDFHDIPQIIFIITTLIKQQPVITSDNAFKIIKFIIYSILDAGVLPIPQFEIDVAKRVADASLDLLIINLPEIKRRVSTCMHLCCGCACCAK